MIRECRCRVQVLAHKENAERTLFPRHSKATAMKVGICLEVCRNVAADLLHYENTRRPVILHHYNHHPPITKNMRQNRVKMG